MSARRANVNKKMTELSLTEISGLFHAKRLKEKHHGLLEILKKQYGKPKKSVKEARKAWKDKGESFSDELISMREE